MRKQGFILVEVLIALAISSMLSAALFFALFQVTQEVRIVDDVMNVYSRALIATRQLEHDLAGATLVQEKVKKIFFSENKDANCQLLTFITNNPLQQWHTTSLSPYLVRVTYRLILDKTADKNKGKRYILTRQESVDLNFEQENTKNTSEQKKARAYELVDGVVGLSITYTPRDQDEKSQEEKSSIWDSDSKRKDGKKREPNQMLPASITVELTLMDSKGIQHIFTSDILLLSDMTPLNGKATDTVSSTTDRGHGGSAQ